MRIAYVALHYGVEYLKWAIRSVQGAVDEIHLLYSPNPSFGHQSTMMCPETEEELRQAVREACLIPYFWVNGSWRNEGEHRNAILYRARERGAKLIVTLDADEIWPRGLLEEALAYAEGKPERDFLIRMIHLWRSFGWACSDPCMPVRIVNPDGAGTAYLPESMRVMHFGYAQSPTLVHYKQEIHGHKAEWRAGWYFDKFLAWKPENGIDDVHPTNLNFWTPKPSPPEVTDEIMAQMSDHPYYGRRIIE